MEYINKIICGSDLEILPKLPAGSVNCCVTSPPYWGLRDYGVEPVIWDGDREFYSESLKKFIPINCKHDFGEYDSKLLHENRQNLNGGTLGNPKYRKNLHGFGKAKAGFCSKCGAWRGSLGLEPTLELYIKHLCDIFDEIKRVLRKDGTCFVNIGDSYGGNNSRASDGGRADYGNKREGIFSKANAKSLCLIPQRFVIEMVNRGWILRNTIIWHKPNCMPSSAKDRFTVDFEYIYFFVKSKKYWFEQQFEEYTAPLDRWGGDNLKAVNKSDWDEGTGQSTYRDRNMRPNDQGRNKRAVWTIPTQPFPEAHFAVYPEKLIEPIIKAGCPRYVCKKCGKARVKIIEYKGGTIGESWHNHSKDLEEGMHQSLGGLDKQGDNPYQRVEIGYTDCGCNAGFEGGIIIDPFMGAGTTAVVAKKQGKKYTGIEIKQDYIDMANKRIRKIPETLF